MFTNLRRRAPDWTNPGVKLNWSMFFGMGILARHQIWRALWSGLRRKCPRCHCGPLFIKRYTLYERCPECDYQISTALDDLVILTYIGSASITGFFLLAVFVIRPPKSGFEMLIYLLVAFGFLFGTLQHRKGFAIGLLYAHNLLFGEEVEENKPNADRLSKRASRSEHLRL